MSAALELGAEEEAVLIDGDTGGPVLSMLFQDAFRAYVAELDSTNRALADGTLERTDFSRKTSSRK